LNTQDFHKFTYTRYDIPSEMFETLYTFHSSVLISEDTPRKLATATQPQFPRNVADFKQAIGFQISRRTLRKLTFD
jgi:hypothetical protein